MKKNTVILCRWVHRRRSELVTKARLGTTGEGETEGRGDGDGGVNKDRKRVKLSILCTYDKEYNRTGIGNG